VLAAEHGIPFYVAAPLSTFDTSIASGEDITIEERDEEEIRALPGGKRIPDKVRVWNPAFDVTPARLVTAFICEKGVFRFPFDFRK
jgi:methylthioribose-1-phosphate isomerase